MRMTNTAILKNSSNLEKAYISVITDLVEDYVSSYSKDFPLDKLNDSASYRSSNDQIIFEYLKNEDVPDSVRRALGEDL